MLRKHDPAQRVDKWWEEEFDAVVEGADQSVNIRINNKKLFPDTKPPIPQKKVNDSFKEERASTPDRENDMRENIRNRLA